MTGRRTPDSARLDTARQATRDLDAKASGLLTATGVLAATGSLLGDALDAGPVVVAGLVAAGAGLLVAVLTLLLSIAPRGGSPAGWLTVQQAPGEELARVSQIAARKHLLVRLAVAALSTAVVTGGITIAIATIGRA